MLTTQRLLIRELGAHDINCIHQLLCLPETDEYNTLGIPANIYVTENLLKVWLSEQNQEPRDGFVFGIDLKDKNEFIGLIALRLGKKKYNIAETWFKIHKDFWRNNLTTEALSKLLDFGFDQLKLHRIEAGCAVENIASWRVLEKAGAHTMQKS